MSSNSAMYVLSCAFDIISQVQPKPQVARQLLLFGATFWKPLPFGATFDFGGNLIKILSNLWELQSPLDLILFKPCSLMDNIRQLVPSTMYCTLPRPSPASQADCPRFANKAAFFKMVTNTKHGKSDIFLENI